MVEPSWQYWLPQHRSPLSLRRQMVRPWLVWQCHAAASLSQGDQTHFRLQHTPAYGTDAHALHAKSSVAAVSTRMWSCSALTPPHITRELCLNAHCVVSPLVFTFHKQGPGHVQARHAIPTLPPWRKCLGSSDPASVARSALTWTGLPRSQPEQRQRVCQLIYRAFARASWLNISLPNSRQAVQVRCRGPTFAMTI